MLEGIVRIRNAKKTNDWSVIQDEFDEVNRLVEKSKMLISQNGIPKFYIKMIAEVEEHLWATMKDKDLMKNMKPVIGRAVNRMKLTIKKHNKNYEEQIADYRANPEKYEEEVVTKDDDSSSEEDSDEEDEDDDSDSESDSDVDEKPKSKPKARKVNNLNAYNFCLSPVVKDLMKGKLTLPPALCHVAMILHSSFLITLPSEMGV